MCQYQDLFIILLKLLFSKVSKITYFIHLATLDLVVIYDSHLYCHITHLNNADSDYISQMLVMTQTCNDKLYYKNKNIEFFSKDY